MNAISRLDPQNGMVLTENEARSRALKEGRCEYCGTQLFKVKRHKFNPLKVVKIPLTVPGEADNGKCMECDHRKTKVINPQHTPKKAPRSTTPEEPLRGGYDHRTTSRTDDRRRGTRDRRDDRRREERKHSDDYDDQKLPDVLTKKGTLKAGKPKNTQGDNRTIEQVKASMVAVSRGRSDRDKSPSPTNYGNRRRSPDDSYRRREPKDRPYDRPSRPDDRRRENPRDRPHDSRDKSPSATNYGNRRRSPDDSNRRREPKDRPYDRPSRPDDRRRENPRDRPHDSRDDRRRGERKARPNDYDDKHRARARDYRGTSPHERTTEQIKQNMNEHSEDVRGYYTERGARSSRERSPTRDRSPPRDRSRNEGRRKDYSTASSQSARDRSPPRDRSRNEGSSRNYRAESPPQDAHDDVHVIIMSMFSEENPSKMRRLCKNLHNLLETRQMKIEAIFGGALMALNQIVNGEHVGNESLQDEALLLILDLIKVADESIVQDLNFAKAVTNVLVCHPFSPDIVESAVGILRNLSDRDDEYTEIIADQGGVDIIRSVIENHNSRSLTTNADALLYNLSHL